MNKGLIKPVSLPPAQAYAISIRAVIVRIVVTVVVVAMIIATVIIAAIVPVVIKATVIIATMVITAIVRLLSYPCGLGFERLNCASERRSVRAGD